MLDPSDTIKAFGQQAQTSFESPRGRKQREQTRRNRLTFRIFAQLVLSIAIFTVLLLTAFAGHAELVPFEEANRTSARGENLAAAAERVLQAAKETHYQHKTHIDAASGVYDVDCSGFVDYLMKRLAPEQFARLPIEAGHTRPRARVYFEFLRGLRTNPLPGWESVPFLSKSRPGDILAWERVASRQETGDTGHVAIVAAAPVRQSDGTLGVEVYDSSAIRHDSDSRPEGTNGVGKGVITFRVNFQGEPIAFRFNADANFHKEPIAIGRIAD